MGCQHTTGKEINADRTAWSRSVGRHVADHATEVLASSNMTTTTPNEWQKAWFQYTKERRATRIVMWKPDLEDQGIDTAEKIGS